jgi:hypothetical protein
VDPGMATDMNRHPDLPIADIAKPNTYALIRMLLTVV